MNWLQRLFGQKRAARPARSSGSNSEQPQRIDLASYTPDLGQFLALAATVQDEFSRALDEAETLAPSPAARKLVADAHNASRDKTAALLELAQARKIAIEPIVREIQGPIDEFRVRTTGADWWEQLVTWYITSGLLDDVLLGLSTGLKTKDARAVADIFGEVTGRAALAETIAEASTSDPKLANRLALWGRRLVGDTLLVARLALHVRRDDTSVEPVFGELMAGHARRMGRLGLTA